MPDKYLLIDGNALGYAGHNTKILRNADGEETQAIYGFLNTLRVVCDRYEGHMPIVLWDGRAQFRYDILPEYKGKRKDTAKKIATRESYKKQKPYIETALKTLGVPQAISYMHEADDLAGYFVRYLGGRGREMVLVTGDHDWQQLVRENVSWVDPRDLSGSVCTINSFHRVTRCRNPKQFLEAKAILGDNSDNIPGVRGLGKVAVERIVKQFPDMNTLFEYITIKGGKIQPEDLPADLRRFTVPINRLGTEGGKMIFERNLALMDLMDGTDDLDIKRQMIFKKGTFDMDEFESFCLDMGFNTILRQLPSWEWAFSITKEEV